jgi:hypothetical protein
MTALINYDGGENEVRTNIPTRFHLAWWLSASLTTLRSLKNNDLRPEEQRLAAAAYIYILPHHHHQHHHPQNALGCITNPSLSQRSEPFDYFSHFSLHATFALAQIFRF